MVKVNTYIYGDFISLSLNSSIKASKFPENLKLADITPIYKKGKKDLKKLPTSKYYFKFIKNI